MCKYVSLLSCSVQKILTNTTATDITKSSLPSKYFNYPGLMNALFTDFSNNFMS